MHPRLAERVRRHADTVWQQPLHAPTIEVFEQLLAHRHAMGLSRPLVIDAGCGTGESTRKLSGRHPEALVFGLDRSSSRLSRVNAGSRVRQEGRVLWARVELETFWRLALDAQWTLEKHYLLYPNPWPKSAHLGRRWHGHPIFPTLLALGGELELRCNWLIYAQEFQQAAQLLTGVEPVLTRFEPGVGDHHNDCPADPHHDTKHGSGHDPGHDPQVDAHDHGGDAAALSPFEAKYHASGHSLWRVVVN